MKKKILSAVLIAVMALSVFTIAPTASAKAKVSYKSTSKTYTYNGKAVLKAKVKIPVVSGKSTAAKKINKYFAKIAKSTLKSKGLVKYAKEDFDARGQGFVAYANEYKAKLSYNKSGKMCFKIMTYSYTGGAHGGAYIGGVVFDKKTGKKLPLSKWTKLSKSELKSKILKATKKMIDKDPDRFMGDSDSIIKSLKSRALNKFTGFLRDKYLYIVYQQYDIAPYAAGSPYVKIKL